MADNPSLCSKPVDIICLKLSLLTHFSSVKLSYRARLEMALHGSFILVALHNRDNQCKAPCKRTQRRWQQLPTLLDVTCSDRLHTLLHVVAYCCAKFETGQTFKPTTPNISFDPWSPKRGATTLDMFAQLFQHWWGPALALYMVSKSYGLYPSHDALQVPTLSRVVASACA